MTATGSHDLSISDEDFVKHAKVWEEWVEQEVCIWKEFHDFWIKARIPVHIIRYEDIL